MPLRDHFRAPLDEMRHWEGLHAQWPGEMVRSIIDKLPEQYFAEPRVHSGVTAEVDVATFQERDRESHGNGRQDLGGVVTATWAPPRPSFTAITDFPSPEEFEVRVFDAKRGCRLVAAVEIVSPANKDRPEHRRAFVAKCAGLLQNRVSVIIIDLVTTRAFNLYRDLLELIGEADPAIGADAPATYAAACRGTRHDASWLLETWARPLALEQTLPTLPLWLADDLAIPLDLEETYEETCRILRIP